MKENFSSDQIYLNLRLIDLVIVLSSAYDYN
jgi:hypothetical protein